MKLEEQDIMDRNYKMAKKVLHLQPLTESEIIQQNLNKSDSESDRSVKRIKLQKKRSLQTLPKSLTRFQVYLDTLNEITNGRFAKSKSFNNLNIIDQKVNHNTVLCLAQFKEFKFFDQYDFSNPKVLICIHGRTPFNSSGKSVTEGECSVKRSRPTTTRSAWSCWISSIPKAYSIRWSFTFSSSKTTTTPTSASWTWR
jgi:hypothetical protein